MKMVNYFDSYPTARFWEVISVFFMLSNVKLNLSHDSWNCLDKYFLDTLETEKIIAKWQTHVYFVQKMKMHRLNDKSI